MNEMTSSAKTIAVEFHRADSRSDVLIVCDHASNALPAEYGDLGLGAEEFNRHIAFDIGAAAVARILSDDLDAPAVLGVFSRLLIDLNRGEDDPTLVMKLSDGAIISGNRYADEAEIERRKALYYTPYHDAIRAQLAKTGKDHEAPVLISIHSFTDAWKGDPRPWHIGILWDKDGRMSLPLIENLANDFTPEGLPITVGDNQPYHGEIAGDCMNIHGTGNGFAHVLVEIRQDLISDAAGAKKWADILARNLAPVLGDPDIYVRKEPL